MATETAYRTGTISSGHDGTTITATLSAAVAADDMIGRILYLTGNNSAQGRYRRITDNGASSGDDNTTSITIDAAFGGGPLRGLTPSATDDTNGDCTAELAATATNTFTVSKPLSECNAADIEDVSDADNIHSSYRQITPIGSGEATTRWSIPSGVVVYDEDVDFDMIFASSHSSSGSDRRIKTEVLPGGALIFGRQNLGNTDNDDEVGWTSNGCKITDRTNDLGPGTNAWGAVHFNGCIFTATEAGGTGSSYPNRGPFWRFQGNSSLRFWETTIGGRWGGRFDGVYSAMYKCEWNNDDSRFGPAGPLGNMGVFEDTASKGSRYALYSSPENAGSSVVGSMNVQSPTVGAVYANVTAGADSDTTTQIRNWDFDQLDANTDSSTPLLFVDFNSGANGDHTYQFRKDYKLDFNNSDGTDITDGNGGFIIVDVNGDEPDGAPTATTNGSVAQQDLLAYTTTLTNGNDVAQLSDMTAHTDYSWAAYFRNHNIVTGTTNLRNNALGRVTASAPRLTDNTITNTTITEVDDYTELETAAKIYDFQGSYKIDNMAEPTRDTLFFDRSGTTIETTGDYNVIFANGESNVFAYDTSTSDITIEVPSTGYTENITAENGKVTFNATVQGSVECDEIDFSGTTPSTIIDTDGTITTARDTSDVGIGGLVGGQTYTITGGADISNAKLSRTSGSGNATVILENAVGGTSVQTSNVTLQEEISFTIELPEGDTASAAAGTFKYRAVEYDGSTVVTARKTATTGPTADSNTVTITFRVAVGNTIQMGVWHRGYAFKAADSTESTTVDMGTEYGATQLNLGSYDNAIDSDNADYDSVLDGYVGDSQTGWSWAFASDTLTITAPDTSTAFSDAIARVLVYQALAGEVGEDKSDNSDEEYLHRLATKDIDEDAFVWEAALIRIQSDGISGDPGKYEVLFNHTSSTTDTEWSCQMVDENDANQAPAMSTSTSAERVRFAGASENFFIGRSVFDSVINGMGDELSNRNVTGQKMIDISLNVPISDD